MEKQLIGYWNPGYIEDEYGFKSIIDYDCSNCNMASDEKYEYCPNCGARMKN